MKRRPSKVIIIVLALVAFITSMSFAGMKISSSKSLNNIYDVGRVCEFWPMFFNYSSETVSYSYSEKTSAVMADEAWVAYSASSSAYAWKYLCCNMDKVSDVGITWDVAFCDADGNVVSDKVWNIVEGQNIFELDGTEFSSFVIRMYNQNGKYYSMSSMSLRDSYPVFSLRTFAKLSLLYFLIIASILGVLYALRLKFLKELNWYAPVEALQCIFMKIGNNAVGKWNVSYRIKRWLRGLIFMGMFFYSLIVSNAGLYSEVNDYKYIVVVCSILLLLIAFLSIEKKLELQDWKNPLVGAWFGIWIMAIISDFIVDKRYSYCGWLMLLIVTFFIFIYNNMEHPYDMLEEFMKAMEGSYVIVLIYCLIFRPKLPGLRYCGIYTNPNVYAMYLIVIYVILLVELDKRQITKKWNGMNVVLWIGGLVTAYQIWLSQSLTGCMAFIVTTFVWILAVRARSKQNGRQYVVRTLVAIVVALICTVGFKWGINHIPQKLGTQQIYVEDDYQVEVSQFSFSLTVNAAESGNFITNSRLYDKIVKSSTLDKFTAGRNFLYKAHLRQMNLFGHYFRADASGKGWSPHNEVIGIAYRYGVFAAIPYVLMLFYYMLYSFRMFKRSFRTNPYAFCLFGIWVAGFSKLMADKFEQPFRSAGWMAFYFLIGFFFSNKLRNQTEDTEVTES